MSSDERLARVARRLALPERGPDERFVTRVDLSMQARAMEQATAAARREQAATEVVGAAALLLALHLLVSAGDRAAEALLELLPALGASALAAGIGWIALWLVSERRRRHSAPTDLSLR